MPDTPESHEFQAEVKKLLDLMIHSLYSNKDIFLRELISNSSDALDRVRFEGLTNSSLLPESDLAVRLCADPEARTLTVEDNGIGMSREEVVENLDARPARALRASGAGTFQMLMYAVLPQALPQLLTYLLYRWEVVIRTTVVVGFVAAGGLGREFRLSMSFFQYDRVTLLLLCYLLLVVGVDLASAGLRRLAR